MTRSTTLACCLLFGLCLSCSSRASGDVIFSQTDSTQWSGSWWTAQYDDGPAGPTGHEVGDDFALSHDAIMGEIRIATMGFIHEKQVRLRLYESSGDVPQADAFYDVMVAMTYVRDAPGGYETLPNFLQSLMLPEGGVSLKGDTRYWWTVAGDNFNVQVPGYTDGDGGGTPGSMVQRLLHYSDGYQSWETRGVNTYFEILSVPPVPEPTSLVLWSGLGVVAVFAARQRKRAADRSKSITAATA